jgi:hypothetical protein
VKRRSKSGVEARLEVQLHDRATVRQHRELGAFVRYSVARIERNIGAARWWTVKIVPDGCAYTCTVIVETADAVVRGNRSSADATLAAWDALCKVEQQLLEARSQRIAG